MRPSSNKDLKIFQNLYLPYLVLLSSLFIHSQIILTRFKFDETSVQLAPYRFKTIIYGYESNIILFFIVFTLLIQGISFIKKSFFIEFILAFLASIWLGLTSFLIYFYTDYLVIGFYFCILASGYIVFLNLRTRFYLD